MEKTDEEIAEEIRALVAARGPMRVAALAIELLQPSAVIKRVATSGDGLDYDSFKSRVALSLPPAVVASRTADVQAGWTDEDKERRRTRPIEQLPVREEQLVAQGKRDLEAGFSNVWRMVPAAQNMPRPVEQYPFHPTRKWRLDFAWPALKVGVEIQGLLHGNGGRHQRSGGYTADCDKLNAAAEIDWVILQYTAVHLVQQPAQTIEQVVRVLQLRRSELAQAQ